MCVYRCTHIYMYTCVYVCVSVLFLALPPLSKFSPYLLIYSCLSNSFSLPVTDVDQSPYFCI